MKVLKIEKSPVTTEELEQYNLKISSEKYKNRILITASDFEIYKRIITVKVRRNEDEFSEITLVNPLIVYRESPFAFIESDTYKSKNRKTVRYKKIQVECDNLGKVEFASDNTEHDTLEKLYSDLGLVECVSVQRLIDAIDGIDVTDNQRKWSETIVNKNTYGRNDKVMMQSSEGDTVFVKYKNAQKYMEVGYKLI